MTDRSKLLALAEAVEKLTGPDREVDVAIHTAMAAIGWQSVGSALYFTASLDAAMTLVPSGHFVADLSQCDVDAGWYARLASYGDFGVDGLSSLPALALTAACLRARAQAEALA